jgi:hypothetical protein
MNQEIVSRIVNNKNAAELHITAGMWFDAHPNPYGLRISTKRYTKLRGFDMLIT